jgi:hypothetical protein
LVCGEAGYRLV